jgi:hypothetical protein
MRSKDDAIFSIPTIAILCGAAGLTVTLLVAGAAVTLAPRPAQAFPAYAQQTGLPCGRCHYRPSGGGPRTAFGRAFAANGHKLPGKKKK